MDRPNTGYGGGWGGIVFGVVIVGVAGAIYWYSLGWFAWCRRGPTPITAAELLAMGDGKEPPSRWVTFTASGDFITTDVRLVMKRMRNVAVSKFVLVPVGKRYSIAQVPPSHMGRTYSGVLGVWEGGDDAEAVAKIQRSVGNAAGRLLHFQFDGQKNPADDVTAVYIAIAVIAGFGSLFVVTGLIGPGGPLSRTRMPQDVPEFTVQAVRDKATWLPR